MLKVLRRFGPARQLVVVGDSAFAALEFLDEAVQGGVTIVTRLRLDAALYEPAPPYIIVDGDDRVSKASGCRPWRRSWTIRRPCGKDRRWPGTMGNTG